MYDTHDRYKLGLDRRPAAVERDLNLDIDWSTVELDGIDRRDYPDFCDAYISYAEFSDGTPLDDDQLEEATGRFGDRILNLILNRQLYY